MTSEVAPGRVMSHAWAEENLLADRYAMGKLSSDEAREFEEHFLDCAKCLETIEIVEGLRSGLRDAAVGAETVVSFRSAVRWALPLAASLLLAIFAAVYFRGEAREARRELAHVRQTAEKALQGARDAREKIPAAAEAMQEMPLAVSVFTLNLTRGAEPVAPENRVSLGASPRWLVLLFDQPGAARFGRYRVQVSTADGRPVGAPADASPSTEGMMAVSLPTSLFRVGDYVLAVENPDAARSDPLARYRFRVVP